MNPHPNRETLSSPSVIPHLRVSFAHDIAKRFTVFTALLAFAFAMNVTPMQAQSNAEGGVYGIVIGASPAELAGASVTIVNKAAQFKHSAPVSSAGTFDFPHLAVGEYAVSVALTGKESLRQDAYIGLGTTTTVRFEAAEEVLKLEKIVVSAANFSPVNVSDPEINFNYRVETINRLPVPRDISSVALTVPGISRGDDNFFSERANSPTTSFAGASISENAYYLNGFNITDFRRGLGHANVPFEFLQEFHVKQFGYSAEFGRSTGGVVDMVSKRGGNAYNASVSVFWEPASLRENQSDSYLRDGTLYHANSIGESDSKRYNLQVSGPLVKNHLFFYGLYEGRDSTQNFMDGTNQRHFRSSKNPFWAGRLDWQINDNHALELTGFSDKDTRVTERYDYPLTSSKSAFKEPAKLGASAGNLYNDFGGANKIVRYTGKFSDDLNLAVLYGTNKRNATVRSDVDADPFVEDLRTGNTLSGTSHAVEDLDRREALRVDGSYQFSLHGSHLLKFGYDRENNLAHSIAGTSGGQYYKIDAYTAGSVLANGAVAPAGTTAVTAKGVYAVGGDFRVVTAAYYAEDNWKLLNDRLLLRSGLRNEELENFTSSGTSLVKMTNQWAPRLSFAYDLDRDGRSKVVGSWGRYFLPIPANISVRLSGAETYHEDYYVLNSIGSNGIPVLGTKIGNQVVYGTGVAKDPATLVDTEIQPTRQDELMLGYERALGKKWKASIKGVYKDLGAIVEDQAVDAALNAYAAKKKYPLFQASGFDYYVLTNPGRDLNFFLNMTKDLNGDGVVDVSDQAGGPGTKEKVSLSATDIGYPTRATRKYYAAIVELEHPFVDKWFGNFSYTWMHSYGNTEGLVLSDIGQDDGYTIAFDQPGLVDYSKGNLANDRRHTFKASGGYQLTKEVLLSGNFICQSGRPLSGLGFHPTDPFAAAYQAASYYIQGKPSPRGAFGRTPWVTSLDLGVRYTPTWGQKKLSLGLDIFNVFNWQTVTAVSEFAENSTGAYPDPRFLRARDFQSPRYVRLSARYDF